MLVVLAFRGEMFCTPQPIVITVLPFYQDEIERKGSILVDYKDLLSNKQISQTLPDLTKELKEMPEKILDCLGLAIHQVCMCI